MRQKKIDDIDEAIERIDDEAQMFSPEDAEDYLANLGGLAPVASVRYDSANGPFPNNLTRKRDKNEQTQPRYEFFNDSGKNYLLGENISREDLGKIFPMDILKDRVGVKFPSLFFERLVKPLIDARYTSSLGSKTGFYAILGIQTPGEDFPDKFPKGLPANHKLIKIET